MEKTPIFNLNKCLKKKSNRSVERGEKVPYLLTQVSYLTVTRVRNSNISETSIICRHLHALQIEGEA